MGHHMKVRFGVHKSRQMGEFLRGTKKVEWPGRGYNNVQAGQVKHREAAEFRKRVGKRGMISLPHTAHWIENSQTIRLEMQRADKTSHTRQKGQMVKCLDNQERNVQRAGGHGGWHVVEYKSSILPILNQEENACSIVLTQILP